MITPIEYKDLTPELARAGCFVIGMPNEAYHAYEGISKSGLDLIDISPAHYAHAEKREQTRAMIIGSAIHAAIFEPDWFTEQYILLRDVTDRRSSAYKEAVKTKCQDLVLTGAEADRVAGMQEAVRYNPAAHELLEAHGWSEISAFVECPETGALLRARFDRLLASGIAVDLKKTQDIRYDKFQRSVANYRYHVQDAFYSRVYSLITEKELVAFKFLCVEEKSPHASKVYQLDDEAKLVGARIAMRNLETYADCDQVNQWPYPDGTEELMSLPTWALEDEDFAEVMV